MNKQLNLIGENNSLELLPSAKVRAKDKVGVHVWTNFYASYSEAFVESAIKALDIKESDVVLDPFVGAGTTLIAAKKMGIDSIGFDIDPFSCVLSRAKLSVNVDNIRTQDLLKPTKSKQISKTFSTEAWQIFDEECLQYATAVFSRIKNNLDQSDSFMEQILFDSTNQFDSEAIALAALCIGASESAKLIQGSNPTWYRKAQIGEKDNLKALLCSTQVASVKMLGDISEIKYTNNTSNIINSDIRDIAKFNSENLADYIITSPPYLTRIDYAMKHFPNLAILSGFLKFDFTSLRKMMIGTPKIIDKGDINPIWGKTCVEALASIKNHDSYASESYYLWTYYQYFKSLFETLNHFKRLLKKGGKGVIILQDSFYKDVHIPLSDIAVEMLNYIGFDARVVVKDSVKQNMKQLNPAHQKKKITKKASEDVIYFELAN
jgi:DNA modification methylase